MVHVRPLHLQILQWGMPHLHSKINIAAERRMPVCSFWLHVSKVTLMKTSTKKTGGKPLQILPHTQVKLTMLHWKQSRCKYFLIHKWNWLCYLGNKTNYLLRRPLLVGLLNNKIQTSKACFDKINILHLDPQCVNHYFPENVIHNFIYGDSLHELRKFNQNN
jgi:hypothetical protein